MTAQFQFFQSLPHKKADFVKKKPAEHGVIIAAEDAEWQEWVQWSQCSVTCGNGTQVRARACGEAKYGGNEVCHGDSSEVQECSVADCLSKFQHPLSH